jgi:TPP-dependent pyruvate/acetoin dehydrogenase alpha subunit
MEISKETHLEMFKRMVRIREFEQASMDVFKRGMIKGAATCISARRLLRSAYAWPSMTMT